MSAKSSRKVSLPPPPKPPRAFAEIEAEFNSILSQAASSQYQAFVHAKTLEQLNNKLLELSQEGAKRKELDAKEKEEAPDVKS